MRQQRRHRTSVGACVRGSMGSIRRNTHYMVLWGNRIGARVSELTNDLKVDSGNGLPVYDRTELVALRREIESFDCKLCGTTLESWNN